MNELTSQATNIAGMVRPSQHIPIRVIPLTLSESISGRGGRQEGLERPLEPVERGRPSLRLSALRGFIADVPGSQVGRVEFRDLDVGHFQLYIDRWENFAPSACLPVATILRFGEDVVF